MKTTTWLPATALALALAFLPSAPARANEPTGPAAAAISQWFRSDLQLDCFNPVGGSVPCGPPNQPVFQVAYGNADGGPGTSDAVAVVLYVNDPTGNGQLLAAAAFRQEGSGRYRLGRVLPGLTGAGLASGSPVGFGQGRATMTLIVHRPGDAACCPTGRRQVSLNLR